MVEYILQYYRNQIWVTEAVDCDIHSVTYNRVLASAGGHPEVDLIRSPTYDVVARLIYENKEHE